MKDTSYYIRRRPFVKPPKDIFFKESSPPVRRILREKRRRGRGERVRRRKILAAMCALALLLSGSAGGGAVPADRALLVEEPPLVALTFDDGPRGDTTGALLDGLALREVPATFFLVGSRLAGREDLVRRMAAEGHQIGVHTYDHRAVDGLSRRDFDAQVGKTRAALAAILGDGDYWLRPPYGSLDETTRAWAGSPLILWSVDPEDWRDGDVDRIVAAVTEHTRDGSIILMHDIFPTTVQAALAAVDLLLERGYCFVTVEQLMARRGIEPEDGAVYRQFPPAG